MALSIRGIAQVTGIDLDTTNGAGKFKVDVKIICDDNVSQATATFSNLPMTSITSAVFNTALKNAVRQYMITNLGFTFGLLDDVALVGSSIL